MKINMNRKYKTFYFFDIIKKVSIMNKKYKIFGITLLIVTILVVGVFAAPRIKDIVTDAGSFGSYGGGGGGYSGGGYSGGYSGGSSWRSSSSSSSSSSDPMTFGEAVAGHIGMTVHSIIFLIIPLKILLDERKKIKPKITASFIIIATLIRLAIVIPLDAICLGLGFGIDIVSIMGIGLVLFLGVITSRPNHPSLKKQEINPKVLEEYGIVNIPVLKEELYNIFKEIEIAWMNFDNKALQKYCTDELSNSYISQLEAFKIKKYKNIMSNFNCISCYPIKVIKENGIISLTIILNVKMKDYIINTETNLVVKGHESIINDMTYELVYVKTEEQVSKFCTNCGAKLNDNHGTKCEYCGSQIVMIDSNWKMSEKRLLKQIRK